MKILLKKNKKKGVSIVRNVSNSWLSVENNIILLLLLLLLLLKDIKSNY